MNARWFAGAFVNESRRAGIDRTIAIAANAGFGDVSIALLAALCWCLAMTFAFDENTSGKNETANVPADAAAQLAAGLTALKENRYQDAIAPLELVYESAADEIAQLRAQMGLVTAYERTNQPAKALALCQELTQVNNQQVSTWANQALSGFAERYPHLVSSINPEPGTGTSRDRSTGEQAKTSPAAPPDPPSGSKSAATDPTGFVPFENKSATDPATPPTTDPTGFVPMEPASPSKQHKRKPVQLPRTPNSPVPNADIPESSPNPSPSTSPPNAPSGDSAIPPTSLPPEFTDEGAPAVAPASAPENRTASPSPNTFIRGPETIIQSSSMEIVYRPHWRNAGRAVKWKPLRPFRSIRYWIIQLGTVVAMFWLLRAGLKTVMWAINEALYRLPWVWPIQWLYGDPIWLVIGSLVVLMLALPWLMDGLLRWVYGSKPLPLLQMTREKPEVSRLLQRFVRQKRRPLPQLRLLPLDVPLIFTYGNWPRTARIVMSQGLLDQLEDDEIAALCASELGHIQYWNFMVMSWATLIVQIPYLIYQLCSDWGDELKRAGKLTIPTQIGTPKSTTQLPKTQPPKTQSPTTRRSPAKASKPKLEALQKFAASILPETLAAIAAIAYGIHRLVRWPVLWLSRVRLYYCDRAGAETTGNPNGLTRALLKLAVGMAQDIQRRNETRYILESFELLLPVSARQATTLGSLYAYTALEPILYWDYANPYRRWLSVNHSHPPLGDRLRLLSAYARYWQLEPELDLIEAQKRRSSASLFDPTLLRQGAPFFGLLFGLALALLLWAVGWVDDLRRGLWFSWMVGDQSLLYALPLVGVSFGIFLRINAFFPDIHPRNLDPNPELPVLLANPDAIPLDSEPIQFQGTLVGRPGIGNWLNQDLMLQTTTGLIKLHHISWMGPVGNLIQAFHASVLIGHPVLITGWFRRGATPWIDVETIRGAKTKLKGGGHPVWSTILGLIVTIWGVIIIIRGSGL